MAAISRRREGADYTWPGYVDALTTLLMVLIFLLSIFSVAQFTLSTVLTNRESAIDTLNRQIADIASQLSLEKRSAEDLQKDVSRLTLLTRQLQTERERLNVDLAGQRKTAEELRAERERLNLDLAAQRKSVETLRTDRDRLNTDLAAQRKSAEELKAERDRANTDLAAQRKSIDEATAERDRLSALLRDATREIETKTGDMQKEIERQRLELTRLAASLAAANNEKGRLFADLTEEQKQTAEQKAATIRLTTEVAGLKDELARLGSAARRRRVQGEAAAGADRRSRPEAQPGAGQQGRGAGALPFGVLRQAARGAGRPARRADRRRPLRVPVGGAVPVRLRAAPAGRREAARERRPAAGRDRQKIPKDINWVLQVDGHTDDKPIKSPQFPSNWELSTARAIAVVKFLNEQGIANENLVAAGYGEYQPLSPTDTARNRRIELKLTNR